MTASERNEFRCTKFAENFPERIFYIFYIKQLFLFAP
jgi:hypothetical protein